MQMFNASELGLDGGNILGAALVGNYLSIAKKDRNGKVFHQTHNLMLWQYYKSHSDLINNEFVIHVVEDLLPKLSNWGDNEEDYEKALVSSNKLLRGLVASNGKYLEVLARDESPEVRIAVLQHVVEKILILKRRRGEGNMTDYSDVPGLEDTSYLDPLVHDSDKSVKHLLAFIGMDRHIRELLHSKNIKDVDIVLKKPNKHRLDEIIAHGEEYITTLAEHNKDMSEEQLYDMAQERSEYIKTGIARVKKSYLMD